MFNDDKNQKNNPGGNIIPPSTPNPVSDAPAISRSTAAMSNMAIPMPTPAVPPLAEAMSAEPTTVMPMPSPARPTPQSGTETSVINTEAGYVATSPKTTINPLAPKVTPMPSAAPVTDDAVSDASSGSEDLLEMKKEALQKLAPLVDKLDQPPEDKFKTLMMLIQASDNPQFVKNAFSAADQISDEQGRAQALLDVVNEINYFTQTKQE